MILWCWVSGTQENALAEKTALADYLRRTTGLELSPEKTKATAMTSRFEFLGFRFVMHWDRRYGYGPRVEIPETKAADLRWKVKARTGTSSARCSLASKLQELNPILRGWANYYRHCAYAGRRFTSVDWYTGTRIVRWLQKKRPKARSCDIWAAYQPSSRRPTRRLCREELVEQHMLAWTPSAASVSHGWICLTFTMSSGEPGA